eukprot:scaffold5777_cov66-Attheya_sp.AAC.8
MAVAAIVASKGIKQFYRAPGSGMEGLSFRLRLRHNIATSSDMDRVFELNPGTTDEDYNYYKSL